VKVAIIFAWLFNNVDGEEETPAKQVEKIRKKSINRALIREMQEEFLDTPIEIHNGGDAFAMQISKEAKDKQRYAFYFEYSVNISMYHVYKLSPIH